MTPDTEASPHVSCCARQAGQRKNAVCMHLQGRASPTARPRFFFSEREGGEGGGGEGGFGSDWLISSRRFCLTVGCKRHERLPCPNSKNVTPFMVFFSCSILFALHVMLPCQQVEADRRLYIYIYL